MQGLFALEAEYAYTANDMPTLDHDTLLPPDASWKEVYKTTVSHWADNLLGPGVFALLTIAVCLGIAQYPRRTTGDHRMFIALLLFTVVSCVYALYRLNQGLKDRAAKPSIFRGSIRTISQTRKGYRVYNVATYLMIDDQRLHYPYSPRQREIPKETGKIGQEIIVSYLPNQKIILSAYVRDKSSDA